MIDEKRRETVRVLFSSGKAKKEIARIMSLDIKTVRSILKVENDSQSIRTDKIIVPEELLESVYLSCLGYAMRMYEVLREEHQIEIGYSTLTRLIQERGLRKKKKSRSGHSGDVPGEEMQHDTSPYTLQIGGVNRKVIASSLYLRYSKMRYIKYYPVFNRFTMKCFIYEALEFFGYCASVCIIDNTNLAISSGTGDNAVFNREMIEFANQFGFRWKAHFVKHSNRKAGVERSFHTIETSFHPGRTFPSIKDLNTQAIDWATVRYAARPQSKSKLIPLELFEYEKPFLIKIEKHLLPPYQELHRLIDAYGYISFNGNYYWIPEGAEKNGRQFKILAFEKKIDIYQNRKKLLEYILPSFSVKNKNFTPDGMKIKTKPNNKKKSYEEEERSLRGLSTECSDYLDFVHSEKCHNRQKPKLIRDIYHLSKRVSSDNFSETLKQALEFEVDSVNSIQRIAQNLLQKDLFPISENTIDSDYIKREEYLKGRFSGEADISKFQDLLENEDKK